MLRKKKNNVFIGDADRRHLPRLPPEAFASLKGEFLGSGTSVKFINISSGGALVESEERLAPSTKIYLRITSTKGTLMLRGRIVRSTISHLKGTPRYHCSIAFDDKFPLQAEDPNTAIAKDIEATAEVFYPLTTPPLQIERS